MLNDKSIIISTIPLINFNRKVIPGDELFIKVNIDYLQNIIDEMTNEEKEYLKTKTFSELWTYLWGDQVGIHYRCEEKTSKDKIEELRIVR